jgi:hypothetical protein
MWRQRLHEAAARERCRRPSVALDLPTMTKGTTKSDSAGTLEVARAVHVLSCSLPPVFGNICLLAAYALATWKAE